MMGLADAPVVHVIGPQDKLRNPALVPEVTRQGMTVLMSGGPNPEVPGWLDGVEVDQARAAVLRRRPLSMGEVAATIAHRTAVARAKAEGRARWAVFLEDDAEVSDDFAEACRQLAQLSCSRPLAVMLYRDPLLRTGPAVSGWPRLRRPRGLPEGAVGYMLNRASMAIYPTTGSVDGVADWPYPWASRQTVLQTCPPVVRSGAYGSLVGAERDQAWVAQETIFARALRITSTVLSLRYVRHRVAYGSWADYRAWEFGRLLHAAGSR